MLVMLLLGFTVGSCFGSTDPGAPWCTNTCESANDGECDDGGEGSDWGDCAYGTDCADCGERRAMASICNDSCSTALDGECDDGGPGAEYDICPLGHDCTDCGASDREGLVELMRNADGLYCDEICGFSDDGECDDGGPGSETDFCRYGSDCIDCGPRSPMR